MLYNKKKIQLLLKSKEHAKVRWLSLSNKHKQTRFECKPYKSFELSLNHLDSSHLPWRACWSSRAQRPTGRCCSRMLASVRHRTPLIPETWSTHGNLVEATGHLAHSQHCSLTLPTATHTPTEIQGTSVKASKDVYLVTWQSQKSKVRRRAKESFGETQECYKY